MNAESAIHPRQSLLKESRSSRLIIQIIKPLIPALIHLALPQNRPVAKETADFLLKSAEIHVQFLKPAAEKLKPYTYASKMESTLINMLCDIFKISIDDLKKLPPEVFKGITHFSSLWRIYDDIVDEKLINSREKVTEEMLDTTPIYHKHLKRLLTGAEVLQSISKCVEKIVPGNDEVSNQRKTKLMKVVYSLRRMWVETANSPSYQAEDVLKYEQALDSKRFLTGGLAETGAKLFILLLNIEENPENLVGLELDKQVNITMQFGDDLIDWRKDWLNHIKEKKKFKNIRPIENLFLVTLEENPTEKAKLEKYLKKQKNTIKLVMKYAPETYAKFLKRFEEQLELLPEHDHKDNLKRFMLFSFKNIVPNLPESGFIFNWGKW